MKLLNKTGKYYLLGLVSVVLVGGILFHFLLSHFLDYYETKNLYEARDEVMTKLKEFGREKPKLMELDGGVEILSDNYAGKYINYLRDTTAYDTFEKEIIPIRTLTFSTKTPYNNYLIRLSKSLIERDELVEMTVRLMAILLALFAIVLFLLNRLIAGSVWSPFYQTLEKVKHYQLSQTSPLRFNPTDISEFSELQRVLVQMTDKISSDYHALKEFTENASHEIQTPLAIIQSKLEILIQSENLHENQIRTIQTVYEATNRLSKLNQSLLLLTKIDNRQFFEKEKINLAEAIEKQLRQYEDFIEVKKILLKKELNTDCWLLINPALSEILLSNLLSNAIKHNVTKGTISIVLTPHQLSIENTGNTLESAPSEFFGRFKKSNTTSDSLGLGLAIVEKICDVNQIKVEYNYLETIHSLRLSF